MRLWKQILVGTSALTASAAPALAQISAETTAETVSSFDPLLVGAGGAVALAVAAVLWAMRVSAATRDQSVHWSRKLAEMEARLEKADGVLSAHPGPGSGLGR